MTARRAWIVAGEASGDTHAASLVRALRAQDPKWQFVGIGGSAMADAGVDLRVNLVDQSVMGIRKVVAAIGSLVDVAALFWQALRQDPPDVVILIDYPGLNLNLARMAKRCGIPVIYYIVPQVWAWGPWRVRRVARRADLLLVILPFEREIYSAVHSRVEYVGNPLFEELLEVESTLERDTPSASSVEGSAGTHVAFFPGSRTHEVEETLPAMLRIGERMRAHTPDLNFSVSCHRQKLRAVIDAACAQSALEVNVVEGNSRRLQWQADLALVVSGTVTLEQAFFGTPMVVLYPARSWEVRLFRTLSVTPFIALANLVAGAKIVPEFLFVPGDHDSAKGEGPPTEAALKLLDPRARNAQVSALRALRAESFGSDGIARAAQAVGRFMRSCDST